MTLNKFILVSSTEYNVLKGRTMVNHIFWEIHYRLAEFSGINMAFVVLEVRHNGYAFCC